MKNTTAEIRARVGPLLGGQESPPQGWDEQLAKYLELVVRGNQHVNLVSRRSIGCILEEQLIPSLATLLVIPHGSRARVLDVGTGGGFPGVPLAVLRPGIRLDLVDATRKKAEFLQNAVRELGLAGAAVHWCRIEEPGAELTARAPFDAAFARAVGDTDRVAAAIQPLLARDGGFWVFAAPGAEGSLPWPAREGAVTALLRVRPT